MQSRREFLGAIGLPAAAAFAGVPVVQPRLRDDWPQLMRDIAEHDASPLADVLQAGVAGQENAISPDHRAGMAEAGNRSFPQHVQAGFYVPGVRNVRAVGNARGSRSAKRRPVLSGRVS